MIIARPGPVATWRRLGQAVNARVPVVKGFVPSPLPLFLVAGRERRAGALVRELVQETLDADDGRIFGGVETLEGGDAGALGDKVRDFWQVVLDGYADAEAELDCPDRVFLRLLETDAARYPFEPFGSLVHKRLFGGAKRVKNRVYLTRNATPVLSSSPCSSS